MKNLARVLAAAAVLLGLAGPAQARPATEATSRLRVMPLGDSITWGVGSRTLDSYRGALYWRLNSVGVAVDYVGSQRTGTSPDPDNEGHKGWTIAQIAERVDGWLDTYRPDVVLLHIGTNDMVRGVADAPEQLDALLDRIGADLPEAQVFVAKIVGLADYRNVGTQQQRTASYNAAVARIVAAKGPNFHLVDQSGVRGIDMWNREHPNDFGYLKMAWTWYRALEPVLNRGGRPWSTAGNPFRAPYADRCIDRSTLGPAVRGCHRWYQHGHAWRLPVPTRQRYKAKIKGRTVLRVRVVTRWIAAA